MVASFDLKCVALIAALLAAVSATARAQSADEFPFGLEMTLEAARTAGSKRLPTLEIGEYGEVTLELWCKAGQGQFSVAGNTVVFVPGTQDNRSCTTAQIAADDALIATLAAATTWQRQGDLISFLGPQPLRFRLNSN
jgi:predicted RNA-binding protein with TRAM domain